jgi:invasion protein IalB
MIANHDDNCHYDQQQVNFQSDEFTNESQDIQSDDDVDSNEIQLPAPKNFS